ncbi:hypothetical protein K7957_17880 [Sphingomonas yunnanensis]|uniref:hypothetical protein n=1 Tax=Sphingomonas yunnanensis TaxID=310400 RepID=UPI001CA61412|nr:hypothetical protein [Sphingomonas yunnanensis]MBY9064811.1 hypothetical protein [Sphingomonas yunnanensis]
MFPDVSPPARPLLLLAEAEPFRADYLRHALHDAGAQLLGPVRAVAEGLALLANLRERPAAAIVNLRLGDGTALPLLDSLDALGVPLLLIGEAGMTPPPRLAAHPCLLAPFASYQIVAAVLALPVTLTQPPLATAAVAEGARHG